MMRKLVLNLIIALIAAGLMCCSGEERPAGVEAPSQTPAEKQIEDAGDLRRAAIRSGFPCEQGPDCTFTKYANTPKTAEECACPAACTPFVVSVAERARREAANEKFCAGRRWPAEQCPAPPCGFVRFDDFECVEGRCMGYALGE